jgi:hypothetical protein
VVASGRRAVGNVGRGRVGVVGGVVVGREAPVKGLSSQEGCPRLVVRNFGRVAAAMGGWSEDIGRVGRRVRAALAARTAVGRRVQGWSELRRM